MRTTADRLSDRPSWTRDGARIAFINSAGGSTTLRKVLAKAWDGTGQPEVVIEASSLEIVDAAFGPPHGYNVFRSPSWDLWIAPVDTLRALRPLLNSPAVETSPSISPDGRLLAYVSDESGRREVYVRPLPGPGSRIQVSILGGDEPVWSPRGEELFYRAPTHFMSATIVERPELDVSRRDSLFPDPYARSSIRANYDVFPDGNEFIFVANRAARGGSIFAIANWSEELRRRTSRARARVP